ncbi:MAG: hypothetical protein ACKN9O_01695 [Actinomycetota bacterium]
MRAFFQRRAVLVTLIALVSILGTALPSKSANVLEFLPGGLGTPGYYGVSFAETEPLYGDNISSLSSSIPPEQRVNGVGGSFLCSSMDDPRCSRGMHVNAQLVLPPCKSAEDRMCIDGLSLGTGQGALEKANLEREVDAPTTPADPITGLPRGGAISLWSSPSVVNKSGSKTYSVAVQVYYFQNREKIGAGGKRNNPLTLVSMKASVFPVSVDSGKFYPLELYESVNGDGAPTFGSRLKGNDYDNLAGCAWLEQDKCGRYVDFADDTRVSLTLRMGSEMTGWLYGRMKDVNVSVNPLDKKYNSITIEGATVVAPGAYGFLKKSELANYPAMNERIKLSYGEFGYNQIINSQYSSAGGYSPVGNFEDFSVFEPILKSRPDARAQWLIQSGASANGYTAEIQGNCFGDKTKLLGIVTTNALIYSPSAPEFKNGTLNYKVAGLHHQADGVTLTRGTYDLAIRSETARCIYGFSDAPFQASVSVIGADGQEQTIATESIREDAKREWLFLSAQNFTFSSPVIKVKLTQEKKLTKSTTSTSAAGKKAPTKSITCVKGKIVRKVSGSNPKCPTGFKKR